MSDTPISDSTPHNVAELGMLCRKLERELNATQQRIKRLEEAGDGLLTAMRDDWSEYVDWIDETTDAIGKWNEAKEAKP
jgi:predicted phage tail protein